jgi:TetR/AcrR family tetracycline transcriptional repressor
VPLDRQLILHQAFAVLNEGGLEGLTLRRLAARLGVKAPALYWHFKSKRDLIDEMATEVMRQSHRRSVELASLSAWQEWAAATYAGLRETLLQYRDGAKMFSGTRLTDPSVFTQMEANLRRMVDAGFTLRQTIVGLSALYNYTIGFVIEEQEAQLAPGIPDPRYDLAAREQWVNKDLHPLSAAAGAELFQKHDARFAEGMALIIAGMAESLAQGSAPH